MTTRSCDLKVEFRTNRIEPHLMNFDTNHLPSQSEITKVENSMKTPGGIPNISKSKS